MSNVATQVKPPFRADHVGSLLRPAVLKKAREELLGVHASDTNVAPHDNAQLREVEDRCIREVIAMQERVGLRAATDGELRRRSWLIELILSWEGVAVDRTGNTRISWRNTSGAVQPSTAMRATKRLTWKRSAVERAFTFLKANTSLVPKVTMPAPSVIFYSFDWFDEGTKRIYPDAELFWDDLVQAYRRELASLVAAGATYIQLDDTSIASLGDPRHRDYVRELGLDPDQLLHTYAEKINDAIAGLPEHVTITLHECRGNREGNWMADGGYDPVADVLFNEIDVAGYFLEYDSARAGTFDPLRLLPKGEKRVVLGIMSSKRAELESKDDLKRRIEEAARFAPLDQLALSPQCGFSSSVGGNPLTERDQEAKLARIVEVARDVWGSV